MTSLMRVVAHMFSNSFEGVTLRSTFGAPFSYGAMRVAHNSQLPGALATSDTN